MSGIVVLHCPHNKHPDREILVTHKEGEYKSALCVTADFKRMVYQKKLKELEDSGQDIDEKSLYEGFITTEMNCHENCPLYSGKAEVFHSELFSYVKLEDIK